MENIFRINYTFISPEGFVISDVAYASGKTAKNAAIRLVNFIDLMAYCEYAGRKFASIQSIVPSEKILKNALIQTEKNGRLN